jgi:hypothetical protein
VGALARAQPKRRNRIALDAAQDVSHANGARRTASNSVSIGAFQAGTTFLLFAVAIAQSPAHSISPI